MQKLKGSQGLIFLIMIKKPLWDVTRNITSSSTQCYWFSTDMLNVRVPLVDPNTHKPTDEYIHKYENQMFSAYLHKRHLKRSEIWPKIHIVQGTPQQEKSHLSYQSLYSLKKMMDEDMIRRIAQKDPTQINSAYIISMFSEDYFKEMMDEYVGKVLVSGKAPSSEKQLQLENQVQELYRQFYFGSNISPLERQIQIFYLATKQQKSLKRKVMPKNAYFRCNWRPQDQRLLEDYVNWPDTDLNLSDINYRPYFEPLTLTERLPWVQKFYKLQGGDSFLKRLSFNWSIKKQYTASNLYCNWIATKIVSRLIHYSKCMEFTHKMKIPPDFMIEICVLNAHMWMILTKLKQFDTKISRLITEMVTLHFNRYIDSVIGSLNVKKLARTRRTFHQMMTLATNSINLHFCYYEQTKNNNYKNIDALVWSCIFREKVERYGEEVYLFSEYFVKNWEHIQKFTEEDFTDAIFQFDPYLIDPDYKQKIQAINPLPDQEQFEEQFKSDKADKFYYYSTLQQQSSGGVKIDLDKMENSLQYSFFRSLVEKLVRFTKKYLTTLDKYDHFSEMDDQKTKSQMKEKKSPWKSEADRLNKLDQEFQTITDIRRRRRNSTNVTRPTDKND